MLLVADSGSTKCDWLMQGNGDVPQTFHTMGFNPLFHNTDFIANEIQKNSALVAQSAAVTHIFYYGTSVSSEARKKVVTDALKLVFPNASIQAEHDLMGAAVATCGNETGIACILGTGSNSCFFDGKNVHEKVPALAYILGDEAGGAYFGKELLRAYLYHKLNPEIDAELLQMGATKEEIFKRVYQSEGANVYLASFMPVFGKFRTDSGIQKILQKGFAEFIEAHVHCYENYSEFPTHFVGSIAAHFEAEIKKCCSEMQVQTGIFTSEPGKLLFQYHAKSTSNS